MIVLADTSPINHLVLIGHVDILPTLFGQVVIPAAVLSELQHARTPEPVRQWSGNLPVWIEVRSAAHIDPQIQLGQGDQSGRGNACSIALDG